MISGLDEHYTKSEILSTIEGISYPGGNTKIGAALTKTKLELFEKSARAGVSNIAIVITDGISQDNVGAPAQQLMNAGCTVFSVGIGNEYDKKQLQAIATDPDSQHVLDADFDALDSIIDKIVEIACKGGCSQFSVLAILGSKLLFSECNPPIFKKIENIWQSHGFTLHARSPVRREWREARGQAAHALLGWENLSIPALIYRGSIADFLRPFIFLRVPNGELAFRLHKHKVIFYGRISPLSIFVVCTAICFLKRKMPSDFSYTDVGGKIQQLGKLVFKE